MAYKSKYFQSKQAEEQVSGFKSNYFQSGKQNSEEAQAERVKLKPATTLPGVVGAASKPVTIGASQAGGLDDLRQETQNIKNANSLASVGSAPTGTGVKERTIEDAYAELDTLNAQYNDALRRLESTNREESARARAELESLSPKIDALKEETAYKGTGVDAFKYGTERAASALLNAGENITDFIGAGVYTGIKGAAELAKATPFYQNWLDRQYKEQANARGGGRYSAEDPDAGSFLTKASEWAGEQADKFLDNSVSRDYEQSIIERYQPTRTMEQVTGLGQTVVQMLPGIGVATKVAGAASGINAAAQAANASNAGMAVFGLQAAGGGANEAKQEGATTEQALAYGAATGIMETAIESIAGGIPQLGKGKIQQVMGIIGANPAVAKALDIAGEGGEEGLSAFLTPYFKRAIYDEDAKNATAEEIAQNVIMGMAAAGVLQVGLELPGAIGNMTLPFSRTQSSTVTSEQKTAPGTVNGAEAAKPKITMSDFTNVDSPIWNNVAYEDTETRNKIQNQTHQEMVSSGEIVSISEETLKNVAEHYPDLRSLKKKERTPILNQKIRELKDAIEAFLGGLKGNTYEFEVNGNILDAKLYDTGIREVKEKITQSKASMLYGTEEIFKNARYLYSTGDKTGDPNIYRWNYFYTPVQIGDEVVGVRIAVRDMVETRDGKPESQIYNWGIKKGVALDGERPSTKPPSFGISSATPFDATLDGGSRGPKVASSGVSSVASTSGDIITPEGDVVKSGDTESVGAAPSGYGQNTVGAAQAGFDPYTNMMNKYGAIPEGENPARTVDVPASTNGKDKVSLSARTAMEAQATPDDMVGDIAEEVAAGGLSYIPVTNKQAETAARNIIKRSGSFATALANWTAEVRDGKTSEELTARGALLYNEAANSGDTKTALSILADYAAMVRRGARAVQAARILKTLSPENKLLFIQQTVDKMNERQLGKNGLESLADIKGGINLDTALINEYLNAKTDAERDAALDKIYQNIADQVPSTLADRFNALRYLNMLGNLRTQARNVVGNLLNKGVRFVDKKVEAFIQSVVYRSDPSKKTTTVARDEGLFNVAKEEFDSFRPVIMGEQKYASASQSNLSKEIQDRRTIFKNNGTWGTAEAEGFKGSLPVKAVRKASDAANRFLEGYRNLTAWAMDYGDEVFAKSAYADRMSRYLKAKGYTAEQWKSGEIPADVLDEARATAIQEAQESTFRDSNAFSDAISNIGFKNPQNAVQRGANVALQGTLPFRRTPANVAVQAERHSPLGLINTAVNAVRAKDPNSEIDGNDVIRSLSETLTGTGLLLMGVVAAALGRATGGASEDEDEAQIEKLTGAQEYALVIPGVGSFTYDSFTPASMTFAMGVEIQKAWERNGLSLDTLYEGVQSVGEVALNMSMLSGLNDAFEKVSYSDSPLIDAAINAAVGYFTQGLTSTLGGQIERITEDKRMTTFRDKEGFLPTEAQSTLGKASAKVPGYDYNQIPYIDAWGRMEESGALPFRVLENALSPGYISTENATDADREILRLTKEGYPNLAPSTVSQSVEVTYKNLPSDKTNEKKHLTADEYVRYATTKGQTSYSVVSDMIGSDLYAALSDEEKAKAIKEAYTFAGHVASEEVTGGKHETGKKYELAQKADADLDLSIAEYLILCEKYGSTVMNSDGIRDAFARGVDPEQYASYQDGKKRYDADDNDSYSTSERADAIKGSGMSQEDQLSVWATEKPKWVEKAEETDVDWATFVDYKIITANAEKKADKLQALRDAGYSAIEAMQLYNAIK